MQEFSSISVSSYEAGALADRLTEQSTDGWSVVAIVPTGSTVTAFLSRDADGSSDDSSAAPSTATASAAMLVGDEEAASRTGDDTRDASGEDAGNDRADGDSAVTVSTPESADTSPADGSHPVNEAPGWATGASSSSADSAASAPEVASTPSTPAETATATTGSAASDAGAAPAGWYADPSSRFELRYWDGSQWTEHVSRGGQQHTDPPVA